VSSDDDRSQPSRPMGGTPPEAGPTRHPRRATGARLARLRDLLAARELDAVLVSDGSDVRYLSGFTGEDTLLVVARAEALICTDSRFWGQVALEVDPAFTLEKTETLLADSMAALGRLVGADGAVGFQGGALSYEQYRLVRRRHRGRLRDLGGAVTALRLVKDAGELDRIRRAAEVTDAALAAVIAEGLVGRSEGAVAWRLKEELHRRGAEGPSFPPIVAAGARGALPHAVPGDEVIRAGQLVVIDTGALVEGYASDITRTFATGEIDGELRALYDLGRRPPPPGLAAVRGGESGRAVDAAARAVIDEAGHGAHFGHGTGHGVGLQVHEGPRLGRLRGDPLAVGMVVTVEPGVYLDGVAGVRIEDTVVVTEEGCEVLTHYPKELQTVG
jgi:Xaa-Pro aminopeptidase